MSLVQKFTQFVYTHHLFTKNDQLLLAVSGGCDSVAMAYLCKSFGVDFCIAHCNFQLRGPESRQDALFVEQLANTLSVPFFVKEFDTAEYAEEHKVNIQIAARELRYQWFATLQHPTSNKVFNYILTAHHLNDSIETMLMQLCKGTGIAGLHGIVCKNGNIVRPMLFAKRKEIEEYAKENNLAYVNDSSNSTNKYARNFIRNEVLPLLQQQYPQVEDNLIHTIERLKDVESIYNESIDNYKKALLEYRDNEVYIPIRKLQKVKAFKTVLYEIVKTYHFTPQQLSEIVKLLDAENSKYIVSATHRILKNRNWLIISTLQNEASPFIIIEEGQQHTSFENGTITITHKTKEVITTDKNHAFLSLSKVAFPLLLRKWKDGDYFYPLGMLKKKKVSRFLIDLKLAKTEKEKVWVLESNKKIIWVVGYRIDERFKAIEQKPISQFLFQPNKI